MRKPVTSASLTALVVLSLLPARLWAGSLPPPESASIQATATVINPFGLVPGCSFEELTDRTGRDDWVLQHPGREGLAVEVSACGETVEWIVCSDQAGEGLSAVGERLSVIPAECLIGMLPEALDSCRVTVIYIDD